MSIHDENKDTTGEEGYFRIGQNWFNQGRLQTFGETATRKKALLSIPTVSEIFDLQQGRKKSTIRPRGVVDFDDPGGNRT